MRIHSAEASTHRILTFIILIISAVTPIGSSRLVYAAPPPVGSFGDRDLLQRALQAGAAVARKDFIGALNILLDARPCSETGRQYVAAYLQFIQGQEAADACPLVPVLVRSSVQGESDCGICPRLASNIHTWPSARRQHLPQVTVEGPPTLPPGPTVKNVQQTANKSTAAVGVTESFAQTQARATRHGNTDPVDLFSGSYHSVEADLAVTGLVPLQLTRTYHSAFADEVGLFGKGSGLSPYDAHLTGCA